MCFCKREWKTSKRYPFPKKLIDGDKRDFFYIGRSDIEGKKVYFRVDKAYIPNSADSHVFSNSFFQKMGYNKEYDITEDSKAELVQIVRYGIRSQIDFLRPTIINGKKMWKCKHKGGYFSAPQTYEWIKKNFDTEQFKDTFEMLMDDNNIDGRVPCPAGKPNDRDRRTDEIPTKFRVNANVEYCFNGDAYCAFGNMANAMFLFNDYEAASFFFMNRCKKLSDLIQEYTSIPANETRYNEFIIALRIAREKFGYTTRALAMNHEPWKNVSIDQNVMKYVEIQGYGNAVLHVVCIYNGIIYDGAFGEQIYLSRESMEFIAGDENFLMKSYSLEPSTKRSKGLDETKKGRSGRKRK